MKNKLYKCIECGKLVPIRSKGKCTMCRSKDLPKKHYRYNYRINQKLRLKRSVKMEILTPFFEFHLEEIKKNPFCQNCGIRLPCNITNIAHILPKRSSANPEIMGNLNNCLYLCASVSGGIGCHERFDAIQTTSKVYLLHCWGEAVKKYLEFRKDIVKHNKYQEIFEIWIRENT